MKADESKVTLKGLRVLIVDDHPVVRRGLKQIIAESIDSAEVDEADHAQEAFIQVGKNDYDVVLMDISMPGTNGIEALKHLKNQKPKLPVLVISVYEEEIYAVRSFKAGASAYLTKGSAPDELISAIKKACSGGRYVSAALAEKLALALNVGVDKPLHETLSNREFEVMQGLSSGLAVGEIAEQLCLSPKTISTYRSRILEKMGLKNNAELMQYAVMNSLI